MIRLATHSDIARLSILAAEFSELTEHVKGFDFEQFSNSWQSLIDSCGVIFILDDFDGMLGAIKYPDINSGRLLATECFWYVTPDKRGKGLELLKAFEQWAKDQGCVDVIMVHLMDSMPDRLQTVYKRMGYKAAETHYVKEL